MIVTWQKYFSDKNRELSLLGLFKPIYFTSIFFGLFPYHIKFKSNHKVVIKPRSIYFNFPYVVSIIIFITVFSVLHIQLKLNQVAIAKYATVVQINYVFAIVFLLSFNVIRYIFAYINRHETMMILNALASTWNELPKTKSHILEASGIRILLCATPQVFLLGFHTYINFTRKEGLWKMILVFTTFIFLEFLQLVTMSFYNTLVLMLVSLLTNIEESLNVSRDRKYTVFLGSARKVEPVRRLELIYVKVFEVKRRVNSMFDALLLLVCVQSFHSVVSESHTICHGMILEKGLSTNEIINFTVWSLLQLTKMGALAYCGNLLTLANVRVGQALNNIPTENKDMRTLIEIQHFNSVMSYQAADFTVYGFFSLNASFLFNVVASAAMYLIILVQLDTKP